MRATLFTSGPHLPEGTDPQIVDMMYKRFSENADRWRTYQPHCHIHEIEADHTTIAFKKNDQLNEIICKAIR